MKYSPEKTTRFWRWSATRDHRAGPRSVEGAAIHGGQMPEPRTRSTRPCSGRADGQARPPSSNNGMCCRHTLVTGAGLRKAPRPRPHFGPMSARHRRVHRLPPRPSRRLGQRRHCRRTTAVRALRGWMAIVPSMRGSAAPTPRCRYIPDCSPGPLMDETQRLGATLVAGCVEGVDIADTPARVRGARVDGTAMAL